MPALPVARVTMLAALVQLGASLRRSQKKGNTITIAGVPVHNYAARHMQRAGPAGRFEWVLVLQKSSTIDEFCNQVKCNARGHTTGFPFVSVSATQSEFQDLLEAHSHEVSFAEPDIEVRLPDDREVPTAKRSAANDLWHLDRVGLARSSFTGRGTHIYVMDTGVRSTHQDFGGRSIPTLDTLTDPSHPIECHGDVGCAADWLGHGTHVAGTAGGTRYGVAPEATMHNMLVCCANGAGGGLGTNYLAAMDWIIENVFLPAVMTVSLGNNGQSEVARQAVDAVVNAGVSVTVAAGNAQPPLPPVESCTETFGFISSAIVVGATNRSDEVAWFSNYGSCNDIYAPGDGILSAFHTADDATKTWKGTSMATPMVAGAAALLLEQDPSRSPAKVKQELQEKSFKGVLTNLKPGDPDMLLNVA